MLRDLVVGDGKVLLFAAGFALIVSIFIIDGGNAREVLNNMDRAIYGLF